MDKLANNTNQISLKNHCDATDELASAATKTEKDGDAELGENCDKINKPCKSAAINKTDNTILAKRTTEDSSSIKAKNNDQSTEKTGENFDNISEKLLTFNGETNIPNKINLETHKVSKIVDKETLLKRFARHRSWQDFFETKKTTDDTIDAHFQRNRSNSDGAAIIKNINNADAFPSLPNSVLEDMGLHGDPQKERTSEIQETEQKFTTLSLAFAIDAATIKDRCSRQQRTRDQTENNLSQEIEKLKDKLAFLQPLCTDFESAELLSILLSQVERISRAASEVSTAAERYGAVQHEERLTESVRLMVNYVQALKQQRDSARRQLQCTKKVLQEKPSDSNLSSPTTTQKLFKVITRRRASIATTNQSTEPTQLTSEGYLSKVNRRTSDLSVRASFLNKSLRPNRLELGGDLLKIKEDFSNETSTDFNQKNNIKSDTANQSSPIAILRKNSSNTAEDILSIKNSPSIVFRKTNTSSQLLKRKSKEDLEQITEESGAYQIIREKLRIFTKDVRKKLKDRFRNWSENDYLQAFFNICAILCFSISIVTLVKMYVEYEYSKRGIDATSSYFSWFWSSSPQNPVSRGPKFKKKF